MKNLTKAILAVAFVSSMSVAGFTRSVNAYSSSTVIPQTQSTTLIAQTDDETQDEQSGTKYQNLAKITPDQAKKAAETAGKGKASSVKLENEDGNLIYEVVIGKTEFIVDAGNGKVLYTSKVGQPEDETAEASRPRSSIQVPDTDAGKK